MRVNVGLVLRDFYFVYFLLVEPAQHVELVKAPHIGNVRHSRTRRTVQEFQFLLRLQMHIGIPLFLCERNDFLNLFTLRSLATHLQVYAVAENLVAATFLPDCPLVPKVVHVKFNERTFGVNTVFLAGIRQRRLLETHVGQHGEQQGFTSAVILIFCNQRIAVVTANRSQAAVVGKIKLAFLVGNDALETATGNLDHLVSRYSRISLSWFAAMP
ncbi:hypothetical protein D3C80_1274620 [compost metagenome]